MLSFLGAVGHSTEFLREDPVCPPAIDGDYSEWSDWTACSATCGEGYKSRSRACNDPTPENGGRSCIDQGLGLATEKAQCILNKCARKSSFLLILHHTHVFCIFLLSQRYATEPLLLKYSRRFLILISFS